MTARRKPPVAPEASAVPEAPPADESSEGVPDAPATSESHPETPPEAGGDTTDADVVVVLTAPRVFRSQYTNLTLQDSSGVWAQFEGGEFSTVDPQLADRLADAEDVTEEV